MKSLFSALIGFFLGIVLTVAVPLAFIPEILTVIKNGHYSFSLELNKNQMDTIISAYNTHDGESKNLVGKTDGLSINCSNSPASSCELKMDLNLKKNKS